MALEPARPNGLRARPLLAPMREGMALLFALDIIVAYAGDLRWRQR